MNQAWSLTLYYRLSLKDSPEIQHGFHHTRLRQLLLRQWFSSVFFVQGLVITPVTDLSHCRHFLNAILWFIILNIFKWPVDFLGRNILYWNRKIRWDMSKSVSFYLGFNQKLASLDKTGSPIYYLLLFWEKISSVTNKWFQVSPI